MAITIPEVTIVGVVPKPTVITIKPVPIVSLTPQSWKKTGGSVVNIAMTVVGHNNAVFANETLEISYAAHGTPPSEATKDYWKWYDTLTLDGAGSGQLPNCFLRPTGTLSIRGISTEQVQVPAPGYEKAHNPVMLWVDQKVPIVGTVFLCASPSESTILLQVIRRSVQQTAGTSSEKGSGDKGGSKSSEEFEFGAEQGPFKGGFKSGSESSREWSSDQKSGTSTSTPVNLPTQIFDIQIVKGGKCGP